MRIDKKPNLFNDTVFPAGNPFLLRDIVIDLIDYLVKSFGNLICFQFINCIYKSNYLFFMAWLDQIRHFWIYNWLINVI